ncbi:phage tail protein [Paenibacillus sp. y28]|uniref:phage tail protein n=1 Tax=Paenibacillus sp. y28 TaxID=3129110 RepID=UPI00301A7AE3
MPAAPITVYNSEMRRVALLQNAFSISYETPMNGLWSAQFSLPADDPKNAECQPLRVVEIYDGRERVELFRILPTTARRSVDGQTVTYKCEHVLATLIDDVMFQYHTVGNLGVYTADVLQYILSRQSVQRWQLGTVEFSRQFEYNWENETLLAGVVSVPKLFDEEYQWTWDTTVYPWRLNLVKPSNAVNAYIRYGINMQGIERTIDPTNVCNRLYALGYGEGINQLTFADLNGGKPYIEDTASQAQYGVISRVWVDRRVEYADTLLARAQAQLAEVKQPRVTYTVQASEIHRQTGQDIYRFRSGGIVRVQDKQLGIDFVARIVNVRKRDMRGLPGAVELEIANRPQDIAGTIADLANRQRVNEVYAQGATNLDSRDFADNCDPTHPAILRIYFPEETARINKVRLSYKSEAFRGYNRPIQAAPAVTSGPSSTSTTAAGGQTTSGPSSTSTTAAGGQTTSGPSSTSTTAAGGQVINTQTGNNIWDFTGSYSPNEIMSLSKTHTHTVEIDGSTYTTTSSGSHAHGIVPHHHIFSISAHSHNMDHTHQIASHRHDMDHTHEIAAHTHGMDHTHEIPAHNHEMEYGIFEGPTPTAVTVTVDGTVVTGLGVNENDVDIIPFLAKDSSGKINRGWHEIKITPDNLGRIVANVNTQLFVQSRGGGDY